MGQLCRQLQTLNVSLTKIGSKSNFSAQARVYVLMLHQLSDTGMETFGRNCTLLQELNIGCPYRVRDDLLKNLIYTSFPNLRKVNSAIHRLYCSTTVLEIFILFGHHAVVGV